MKYAIIHKDSNIIYGIFEAETPEDALDVWAQKCGVDNYEKMKDIANQDIGRDNLLIWAASPQETRSKKLDFVIGVHYNRINNSYSFYNVFFKNGESIDWLEISHKKSDNTIEERSLKKDRNKVFISLPMAEIIPLSDVPPIVREEIIKSIPDSLIAEYE